MYLLQSAGERVRASHGARFVSHSCGVVMRKKITFRHSRESRSVGRTNQTFGFPRGIHLKSKDILQRTNFHYFPYELKFNLDLGFLSPLERNLF